MALCNFLNKAFHLRIRVWYPIGKINLGIWLFEIVLKLQLIGFSLKTISTISLNKTNVKGFLLGPFCLVVIWLGILLIWFKYIRFHAFIVKGFSFSHVTNIELDSSQKILIIQLKVVPVGMAFGICVTSQKQIIFIRLDLNSQLQITTFEGRVKNHLFISNCMFYFM
jgi:hypothetical protein